MLDAHRTERAYRLPSGVHNNLYMPRKAVQLKMSYQRKSTAPIPPPRSRGGMGAVYFVVVVSG